MPISPDKPYAVHNGILLHKESTLPIDEAAVLALAAIVAPAVFRLEFDYQDDHIQSFTYRLNGTGFLIDSQQLLTAGHVHITAKGACIEAVSKTHGKQGLLAGKLDATNDLAAMSTAQAHSFWLPIRSQEEPLEPGEICYAIGYPRDLQDYDAEPTLIVSPGRYVGTFPLNANRIMWPGEDDLSRPVFHFDMVALNGHSGSPMVDARGRVVGVWVAEHAWWNKGFVQPLTGFLPLD